MPKDPSNLAFSLEDSTTRAKNMVRESSWVLVVDDDPTILRLVARFLKNKWNVEVVEGAEQAADMLSTRRYHAVITDYEMPDKNGLWLLDYAHHHYPETLRIMSSGSYAGEIDSHIHSGRLNAFLPKPFDRNALITLLDTVSM